MSQEWEIQKSPTSLLPGDLRVAQKRDKGQVDASPHWIRVIEYNCYETLEQELISEKAGYSLLYDVKEQLRQEILNLEKAIESERKLSKAMVEKLRETLQRRDEEIVFLRKQLEAK